MRELILKPVLSDEQLAALDNQFLSSEHVSEEISTSGNNAQKEAENGVEKAEEGIEETKEKAEEAVDE